MPTQVNSKKVYFKGGFTPGATFYRVYDGLTASQFTATQNTWAFVPPPVMSMGIVKVEVSSAVSATATLLVWMKG